MQSKFDALASSLLEMAATYKDIGSVKSTLSDIKAKNLPHHYQKPLIAIADDNDRDEMIDKVITKVFGTENFNANINTKKELQDALEKAVVEVSNSPGSKFKRPVTGVSANYLGRWLGTNINVAYSTETAKKQIEDKGITKQAATQILQNTLTPTESDKEELTKEEPESTEQSSEGSGSSKENSLNKEYSFDERTFQRFKETIEKANKRNARYGIPSVQIEELGEEFVDVKERQAGERFFNDILHRTLPAKKVRKVKFKLTVPELKMEGGWEFIGRVDHEAIGNLIVSVPGTEHGVDLHKMFGNSEPSYCDHCNTTRRRTSTFVLKNAEGKIKRVGRQCLKDYLPGGDKAVSQVVSYAQYLSDIEERLRQWQSASDGGGEDYDEGMGGGSWSMSHFNARGIIGVTIAIVKAMGYMSKSQANKYSERGDGAPLTTADVIDMMYNDLDATKKEPKLKEVFADLKENNENYTKEAEKIVDWADSYLDKQLEDQYNKMREYYQNLSTIVKGIKKSADAHIPKKYLGYLVSIVPLYNKHVESENAEKKASESGERVSQYVGMIGMPIGELNPTDKRKLKKHNENFPSSKVELNSFPYNGPITVTVDSARTFQRQSYSYYDSGLSYMYSMTDDKGNVYVYFASQEIDLKAGDKAEIVKATIKNHKDYTTKSGKTIKQTYLTRVKFDEA
jgi:hypothetical protein